MQLLVYHEDQSPVFLIFEVVLPTIGVGVVVPIVTVVSFLLDVLTVSDGCEAEVIELSLDIEGVVIVAVELFIVTLINLVISLAAHI